MSANQPTLEFDLRLPSLPKDTVSPSAEDIKNLYDAVSICADQIQVILDRLLAAGIP